MEREDLMNGADEGAAVDPVHSADGSGAGDPAGRRAPSFRAWAISIIAAVVLSVTATLLLGGTFGFTGGAAGGPGCGPGSSCCPPPGAGK